MLKKIILTTMSSLMLITNISFAPIRAEEPTSGETETVETTQENTENETHEHSHENENLEFSNQNPQDIQTNSGDINFSFGSEIPDVGNIEEQNVEENIDEEYIDTSYLNEEDVILEDDEVSNLPENEEEILLMTSELVDETVMLTETNLTTSMRSALPQENIEPSEFPITADGISIEKATVRWKSVSTGQTEPAKFDDLVLVPSTDTMPNQQWQLDFALSGKGYIEAGDLEIVIPAYIWKTRDGKEPGRLTLAIPEEPSTSKEFAWKRVGDTYVITNTKKISAATKYMIQGTYRMTYPDPNSDKPFSTTYAHEMNDIDTVEPAEYMGVSDWFYANIMILTPHNQEEINARTNSIRATVDTSVAVTSSEKKVVNKDRDIYLRSIPSGIDNLLPENPEDYYYVRWYVGGTGNGNQPYNITLTDTLTDNYNGIFLGFTSGENQTLSERSGSVDIYSGSSFNATKSTYAWTAYPKSSFLEENKIYTVTNQLVTTVSGVDDLVPSTMTTNASASFRAPITWRIEKVWEYNEDKYDTPLEQRMALRPEETPVWLTPRNLTSCSSYNYSGNVFRDKLNDENNWYTEWTDDGIVRDYDAYEYNCSVTRSTHGANGVSTSIVSGPLGDRVYLPDGSSYQKYWWYDHRKTDYDVENHKWTFYNDYHEGITWTYPTFSNKRATNHLDDLVRATSDKGLVLLRDGKNSTELTYTMSRILPVIAYTMREDGNEYNQDDLKINTVRLEMVDHTEYFADRKLSPDEYHISFLTMNTSAAKDWVPTDVNYGTFTDQYNLATEIYGLVNNNWVRYATIDTNGVITPENGATSVGRKLMFNNENVKQTKAVAYTDGAIIYMGYDIGVVLHPSEAIVSKINNLFEVSDYIMEKNRNVQTTILYEGDTNTELDTVTNSATSYLHGRNYRLAVDLDKKTAFTENNREERNLRFKNTITLNRVSNITNSYEFNQAVNEKLLADSDTGTFYDLLPPGMRVDESSIKAESNVTIQNVNIIENYKDSGSQLLIIKADLQDKSSVIRSETSSAKYRDETHPTYRNQTAYGWLPSVISFDMTYSYDEARNRGLSGLRNNSAYIADEENFGDMKYWKGEKNVPSGENHKESLNEIKEKDRDLMSNLSNSTTPNTVYAGANATLTEVDFSALTHIVKHASITGSDEWNYGHDNEINVPEGGKYSYRITLTSGSETTTKDIIILDALENYVPVKVIDSGDSDIPVGKIISQREFNETNEIIEMQGGNLIQGENAWAWKGYFNGIDVSEIRALGVDAKIYYSTKANINVSDYNNDGVSDVVLDILNNSGDWSLQAPSDLSTVTAIAIDCRKKADGGDFELKEHEGLIAYIHMKAPNYQQAPDAFGVEYQDFLNNAHAFNNVYMDVTQIDDTGATTHSYDHFDFTQVGIYGSDVEVIKVWDDHNDNDRIRPVTLDVELFANGEGTGRIITLNAEGNWQGAFEHVLEFDDNGDKISYSISETVNDYISSYKKETNGNITTITATNKHDLYQTEYPFIKQWHSEEPDGWKENMPNSLVFRLYADGVFTGKTMTVTGGKDGDWTATFKNLQKFKDGELIQYSVEEVVPSSDWIVEYDGNIVKNTYYPYGDLRIEKSVVNATEQSKINQFTFLIKLMDKNNEPLLNEYEYFIYNENDEETASGKIMNGGEISIREGQYIYIKDIPSGAKYTIEELPQAGYSITNKKNTDGRIVAGTPAVAEFTNTYHTSGSNDITGNKQLTGRTITRGQFRFTLHDENDEQIRTASNQANGSFSFGNISFSNNDNGKEFTYTVKETDRGRSGYTYDSNVYTVKMYPIDNGDGTMTVTKKIFKNEEEIQNIEFFNEYHASGETILRAWKTLEARNLQNEEFEFELLNEDGEVIDTKKNTADGSIIFDAIQYSEKDIGKTFNYIIREKIPSEGDGDYDETVIYDESIYGYSVYVVDNGDGTLSFTQSSLDTEDYYIALDVDISWLIGYSGARNYSRYNVYRSDTGESIAPTWPVSVTDPYFDMIAWASNYSYPNNFGWNLDYSASGAVTFEYVDGNIVLNNVRYDEGGDGGYTVYTMVGQNVLYKNPLWKPKAGGELPVFKNTLRPGSLSVGKRIQNSEDTNKEFKFKVKLIGPNIENQQFEFERGLLPYNVTLKYNANSGKYTDDATENEFVYLVKDGVSTFISGEYEEPTREGYTFNGWYEDKEFTQEFTGNPEELLLTENKTVYARWQEIKYAVQIYGIGQDENQNGKRMGLTFGPALGQDFMNTYISHTPSGTTTSGNAHRCVHNDTWEEIVHWNNVDPYVYEQCISQNCTHSVNLTFPDYLKNTSFVYGGSSSGDGVGTLYNEFNNQWHRSWNPINNDAEFGTNKDGWGASRIRAMMNGYDELTMLKGSHSYYSSSLESLPETNYIPGNTLIEAFPQVLQNNIGARKTLYDSVYNQKTEANLKTSYDKLWLLSVNEMADSISSATNNHPLEAPNGKYQKFVYNNLNVSFSANNAFRAFKQSSATSNSGTSGEWWLRSSAYGNDSILAVYWRGNMYSDGTAASIFGVSPCFALDTTYEFPIPITTKYAVQIYGIGQDENQNGGKMGLTFGPALGQDFMNTYISHTPSGLTEDGNEHRCVHNDTWEEIVYWNDKDPYVYEQCVAENCTHSVELRISNNLKNPDFEYGGSSSGDGVGMLYNELVQNDNGQHLEWNPLQSSNSTEWGTNYGGWGASRIRAMMNGADSLTTTGTSYGTFVTDEYLPTMAATDYTGSDTLLSAFPQILQDNIGARKTLYDSVYDSKTSVNLKTSYDKLWLLSPNEMTNDNATLLYNSQYDYNQHPLESNGGYQKFLQNNQYIKGYKYNGSNTVDYYNNYFKAYGQNGNYNASGGTHVHWTLRSSYGGNAASVLYVNDYGYVVYNFACSNSGISPCFALDTTYEFPRPVTTKYAVQIYGIEQDTLEDGSTAGLTFGPALGQDFMNTYISHTPSGNTTLGNAHRCVHDDNWKTIVHWNNVDPYVYEQCVAENCTHSIELSLSGTLKNPDFVYGGSNEGEGVGTLYYEMQDNARIWNAWGSSYGGNGNTSRYSNVGGWGASNIRAVLNGVDSLTTTDTFAESNNVTSNNALISAFPAVLRNAIGARKTLYDSVHNQKTEANLKTSYDKLWLLSPNEISNGPFVSNATSNNYRNHPLEAANGKYQKFIDNNLDLSSTSNNAFRAFRQDANTGVVGSAYEWWLRSSYGNDMAVVLSVYNDGSIETGATLYWFGVSPCFSLARQSNTSSTSRNEASNSSNLLVNYDTETAELKTTNTENQIISNQNDNTFSFDIHNISEKLSSVFSLNNIVHAEDTEQTNTEITFVNGEAEFTLKANEKITFKDIPAGTAYQVWEETPDGWIIYEQKHTSGEIMPLETSEAEITNRYQPGTTSVQFSGSKTLDNIAAAEGSFQFELLEDGTVLQTVSVLDGGFIQFAPITYDSVGTHNYIIQEVDPNNDKLDWDIHKENIRVVITDDGNGNLSSEVTYDSDGIVFANKSRPGTLEIKKQADIITPANKDDVFTFKITLENANGVPLSGDENIYWYKKDANGNIIDDTNLLGKFKAFFTGEDTKMQSSEIDGENPNNNENNEGNTSAVEREEDIFDRFGVFNKVYAEGGYDGSETDTTGWIQGWTHYGYAGSVEWAVDPEGTLWFRPEGGAYIGTMGDNTRTDVDRMPWRNKRSLIKNFKIKEGTKIIAEKYLDFMFYETMVGNVDFRNFDTSEVVSMNGMFYKNKADIIDIQNINTSNVVDMSWMFYHSSATEIIGLRNFDTSKVRNMSAMFSDSKAVELDLSNFKTNNVTDMSGMFGGLPAAIIEVSHFDTSNVTDMNHMFSSTKAKEIVGLENFDTSKVVTMRGMFENAEANEINTSNFDTSNVEDMSLMFSRARAAELNLNNFDTSKVNTMKGMFKDCTTRYINISSFTTQSGPTVGEMFYQCYVDTLNLGNVDFSNTKYSAFSSSRVQSVILGNEILISDDDCKSLNNPYNVLHTGKFVKDDGSGPYSMLELKQNITNNIEGEWHREVINLTFDGNGGVILSGNGKKYATDSGGIHALNHWDVFRPGYKLKGWSTKATVSYADYNPGRLVSLYDVKRYPILYAIWEYDGNGQVNINHYQQNVDNEEYSLVKSDFIRNSPGSEISVELEKYEGFRPVSQKKTITVSNSEIEVVDYYYDRDRYTIEFNGEGQTSGQMNYVLDGVGGVSLTLPENTFSKKGAIFTGWNTKPDGTGQSYLNEQEIMNIGKNGESIVLYAQWKENNEMMIPSDGAIYVQCKAGESIVIPDLPNGTTYKIEEINLPDGWTLNSMVNDTGSISSGVTSLSTAINKYKARGEAYIGAHKSLVGDTLQAEQFSFNLLSSSKQILQTKYNSEIDYNDEIAGSGDENIPNTWKGTAPVMFDALEFDESDIGRTFTYYIEEIADSDNRIIYDTHKESVTVQVSDAGSGILRADVIYDNNGPLFTNLVKEGKLSVSKEIVNETENALNKEFEFEIRLKDSNGNELSDKYPVAIYTKDYSVEVQNINEKAYSFTQNIDSSGNKISNYGNSWNNNHIRGTGRETASSQAHVITIDGAEKLNVSIKYGGESASYDYVAMWQGAYPDYSAYNNYSSSITGRLGGGSSSNASNTKEYEIEGDTVTFSFRSDSSGYGDGYGYYAVILGTGEKAIETGKTNTTISNGETVKIKGGEHFEISGLPHGATYEIIEKETPGWTLLESENTTGTITAAETSTAKFKNIYSSSGGATLEASKELIGGTLAEEQFEFNLINESGEILDTKFNDKNGKVTFNVYYTQEEIGNIYAYYIREIKNENMENIRWDEHVAEYIVEVTDNGEGNITPIIRKVDEETKFRNTQLANLKVSKIVEGNMGNKSEEFDFILKISNQDLLADGITFVKTKSDGSVEKGDVETLPYEFKLSHGDNIEFIGLTDNSEYEVAEVKDINDAYRTSATGVDSFSNALLTNEFDAKVTLDGSGDVKITNKVDSIVPTEIRVKQFTVISTTIISMAFLLIILRRKKKLAD